jgi:hypothetical protein
LRKTPPFVSFFGWAGWLALFLIAPKAAAERPTTCRVSADVAVGEGSLSSTEATAVRITFWKCNKNAPVPQMLKCCPPDRMISVCLRNTLVLTLWSSSAEIVVLFCSRVWGFV